MGRDKALLGDGKVPLLVRMAEAVRSAAGNCMIVAPEGRYEGLGVPVLADHWPGEGPLGGILTAIEIGGSEWNLVVAVDMPLVDAAFLAGLLNEARRGGETVVPVQADGSEEPLCAVYHCSASGPMRKFFDAGGRSVKGALRTIRWRAVPAPERILANINNPGEWEAVRG